VTEAFAPRPGDTGMHTYGRVGGWETIDTQHLIAQARAPSP
jgi:hypothetical protein